MEIKLFLISFLILLFSGAWILSNSALGKKLIMGDRLFLTINIILLVCSTVGFISTIILGEEIMRSHIFEILLLPALAAFVLSGVSRKQKNAEEQFDEKQQSNMKDAAAFSWMVIIFAMFIIYAAYYAGSITGLLFFPLTIYLAFGAYSGSLIYFYRIG